MNRTRFLILALLSVTLSVTLIVACGGGSQSSGPRVAKEPISVRGWITDVEGGENAATFHTIETESARKMNLFHQTNVWVENAPYVSGGVAETGAFLLLDVPPGDVTITFTAPGAPAAHLVLGRIPGNADVFVPAMLLKKGSVILLDPNSVKVRMAAHIDKDGAERPVRNRGRPAPRCDEHADRADGGPARLSDSAGNAATAGNGEVGLSGFACRRKSRSRSSPGCGR